MPPGRYTGLFFLDEATALAAGHRPCAECRNAAYRNFLALTGASGADELDQRLHAERVGDDTAGRRLHERRLEELPDGAFVLVDGEPHLVLGDSLLHWTFGGYADRTRRARDRALVVTPPTSLQVLASGWSGDLPLVAALSVAKTGLRSLHQ
jgi:hypothetical protein